MSLRRRLPGLSANLRRSLSTAAASSQSHPPWAIIDGTRRAADDQNLFMREVAKHRRIGVSEGRLRYAEVSPHDPFVLSCFALDDEGSCWTLEHQVALKQVLADGGYPSAAPQIAVLDPLHTNAIYLKVGEHLVVVDMRDGKFRFVELPEGSSLTDFLAQFKEAPTATFMKEMGKYRRIGVSEGRLRYIEASLHDPFLLSSFVLDDEGRSWTLERQVELRQVLEDGGHPCEEGKRPPQIAVIDPLNADTIYITVGEQKHIVAVDIYQGKLSLDT
uniref:DUF1618 domain-containing protein n=1 Tax=Aegilops tauschii TaxID=37682 RepID=M8BR55_AEGTA